MSAISSSSNSAQNKNVDLEGNEIKTDTIDKVTEEITNLSLEEKDPRDVLDITLTSKEGDSFTVTGKQAKISGLIKETMSGDLSATEIPLPSVATEELKLVIEFMKHHNGLDRKADDTVERPLRSKIMAENVKDPWDAEFIDKLGKNPDNADDVVRLAGAANYLQIISLLHLACSKIASLIKGEPIEKMKKILDEEDEEEEKKEETDGNTTVKKEAIEQKTE